MKFSRRKLLNRLGLTASAPLLAGLGNRIIGEALGAPSNDRCAILVVVGECFPLSQPHGLVPAGIEPGGKDKWDPKDQVIDALPSMFGGLQPFASRTVVVDGLRMNVGTGTLHGTGFGCLTGFRPEGLTPEGGGTPVSVSLDQFVAEEIGKATPLKSVHFGFEGGMAETSATTFSAGYQRAIPHIGSPRLLHGRLFAGAGGDAQTLKAQGPLLDSMRAQIKSLQAELAGFEKQRLDVYLAAVDDFDRRQARLRELSSQSGCEAPLPAEALGNAVQRLDAMFDMATLAVKCGITNVVGVAVGSGFGHDDLQAFAGVLADPTFGGHSKPDVYFPGMNAIVSYLSGKVAGLIQGGGRAERTTAMFVAASGSADGNHHSNVERVPAVVYDGTGTLKTGSRYLRFAKNTRSVVDFYSSVAHAMGRPTADFGKGSLHKVEGPIASLMA